MVEYRWSTEKNNRHKADASRGICFEDIVTAIKSGGLLADIEHTNKIKYPHQRIFVVLISGYVYGVPYVSGDDSVCFLKTAYPSRELSRLYMRRDADEK